MQGRSRSAALIVDPSLRSADGHHFGAVQRLKGELLRLGIGCICLASRYLDENLRNVEGIVPVFDKSIYRREEWTRAEFDDFAHEFCEELRTAARAAGANPDLLIMPSGDQATTLGLAQYLGRYRRGKMPEIVIWLLMSPHFKKPIDDPVAEPLLKEYRDAFQALRSVVDDDSRIRVFCETEVMADAYSRAIGLKVGVVSSPNLILEPKSRTTRDNGMPIAIVCAGNVNAAKGYSLLPEAVAKLEVIRSDLRFLVHGTVENTDNVEGKEILDRLATLKSVTVRKDVLSPEEYTDWLTQADLILLPYDPLVYKTRGSGIFTEAETLGIPVVATLGCEFAQRAFDDGRAMGIRRQGVEELVDAIGSAVENLTEITKRAERFAALQSVSNEVRAVLEIATQSAKGRAGWLERLAQRLS